MGFLEMIGVISAIKKRIKKNSEDFVKHIFKELHNELGFYIDSRGKYLASPKEIKVGNKKRRIVPGITVQADSIPKAYELALMAAWEYGTNITTHYDRPGDPPSKEATIKVEISNPFEEPRIHKNFPGGPIELESYRQEVVDGIHDHLINPREGKWTYTYHDRLVSYNPSCDLLDVNMGHMLPKGVNQLENVVKELKRNITSKAAQATTWIPMADIHLEGDRPCLQRLWFRAYLQEDGSYSLNLNSYWRSRDLYRAWFMNVYAITDLQKGIAERLSNEINKKVEVGSYKDTSDSLHIYGSCWKDMKNEFKKMRDDKTIKQRVWTTDHPAFEMMTQEARENLAKDPDFYLKGQGKL